MAVITDLPNELLELIIDATWPADLEAFALSNKSLYAVARRALALHAKRKKHYSHLELGDFGMSTVLDDRVRPEDCNVAISFLGSLLEDPRLAYYPKSMEVGKCEDYSGPHCFGPVNVEAKGQSVYDRYTAEMGKIVAQCGLIHHKFKPKIMIHLNRRNRESFLVLLLMILLPNLRSILLTQWPWNIRVLQHVVSRAADANRNPNDPDHGKVLAQLQEVSVEAPSEGENIGCYGPFAMLPSMRTLHGWHIDEGFHVSWPANYPYPSSTVTVIDITKSSISASSFESLLCGIAGLKEFRYEYDDGSADYEPAGIIDALRKHARHSLGKLDIRQRSRSFRADVHEERVVGSLHMFSSLKEIILQDVIFQDPEEPYHAPEKSWALAETPQERLVDILPPSVEQFTLFSWSADPDTGGFLQGMAQLPPGKLSYSSRRSNMKYIFKGLETPHIVEDMIFKGCSRSYPFSVEVVDHHILEDA